jgi:N6-adenosine-specific RNA methylase IME4
MNLEDVVFEGPFGAILADPPWNFKVRSAKGAGRSAVAHYDCMDLDAIKALPVGSMAADDSALFLWVTDPFFQIGFEVMVAWGFTFKTIGFHWAKIKDGATRIEPSSFPIGTGYWTRMNPELCLFGTRGAPKRLSKSVRKLVISPRREHSRKPDEIHDHIEALVGGPYLELFARESRPNWTTWGDQTTLFDDGSVDTRRIPSDHPERWP